MQAADRQGHLVRKVDVPGNVRFAGVSQNGKRFAVVVSESRGDPSVVLFEHFLLFDTETGRPLGMVRTEHMPENQSWFGILSRWHLVCIRRCNRAQFVPGAVTITKLSTVTVPNDDQTRQRVHAERMLARAERRIRQTTKLVEKWKLRLAALDPEGVAARQAKLWADDQPERDGEAPRSLDNGDQPA